MRRLESTLLSCLGAEIEIIHKFHLTFQAKLNCATIKQFIGNLPFLPSNDLEIGSQSGLIALGRFNAVDSDPVGID